MCEKQLKLQIILIVLSVILKGLFAVDDNHRGQPLSVEISEEYMDQDYIATNRKRHKIDWNKKFTTKIRQIGHHHWLNRHLRHFQRLLGVVGCFVRIHFSYVILGRGAKFGFHRRISV
uniref:Secreted protein n=1 Tax=Heliconius erato TaxID=33431 RepID=A0A142LSY8_HELEA|nr:hypothetical protein [Heliconius erato]